MSCATRRTPAGSDYDDLIRVPRPSETSSCSTSPRDTSDAATVFAIGNSDDRVIALAAAWCKTLSHKRPRHYLSTTRIRTSMSCGPIGAPRSGSTARASHAAKVEQRPAAGPCLAIAYGVLTVVVNDTYFRSRLQAWIDRIHESWG